MTFGRYNTVFGQIVLAAFVVLFGTSLLAQDAAPTKTYFLKFSPETITMNIGDIADVKIEVVDENGKLQNLPFILRVTGNRGRRSRRAIEIAPRGSGESGSLEAKIRAHQAGTFRLTARLISRTEGEFRLLLEGGMPVEIATPPLEKITFVNPRSRIYTETTTAFKTMVYDAANIHRKEASVRYSSSDPAVASVDAFGNVTAIMPGTITLAARSGEIVSTRTVSVENNPVTSLELSADIQQARTGDVVHFTTIPRNNSGTTVEDASIQYTYTGTPSENLVPGGGEIATPTAEISQDGSFVAETPGYYTIVASSGNRVKQMTIKVEPRTYNQKLEVVGHAPVLDVYTSDLWVWEGVDGRDYAVTGTWSANGEAYFWDVTDPANMEKIDVITVDARTVNDVKVSEDGRIAVISREGASNRKNGIVILDVSDPHNVTILSEFDDELTGGVHNVFIYQNHVYAVNNGTRYDIINIEDPRKPYRVSRFELDTPGHGVHDVWIENGVAYSSNWTDGVQLVDIGGGEDLRKNIESRNPEFRVPTQLAGSPSNPVQFAGFEYPSGWNHAAFPFKSQSTDKFYVLAGDEAFPFGSQSPTVAAGWIHFSEFSDPENLIEVAKYEVPEAGSHNFWIEGDLLYAAFYNGGFRVVDISGELKGNLYRQGREIDWFLPMHPEAHIPNAPMVWGAMPHKGIIYLADHHSGLWAVRLVPGQR